MRGKPREEGYKWLEQAAADLHSAKVLLENNIYHTTCFISQQTAEKALKAYLYAQGEELVTGHSVASLCVWVAEYDQEFMALHEDISILDGYYIPTRYPNGLPDDIPARVYTRKPADESVKLAEKTIEFVKKKLNW